MYECVCAIKFQPKNQHAEDITTKTIPLIKITNPISNRCSFNKHRFSPFGVYPNPTSTGNLVHILHFGGNTLNEGNVLSTSNYNKSSLPEILCSQMIMGYELHTVTICKYVGNYVQQRYLHIVPLSPLA